MYIIKRKRWLLQLLLPLFMVGCGEVMLIGAYDSTVDQSIQSISTDVSTLVVTLKKNFLDGKAADNAYDKFRDTYIKIEAEIQACKIRCDALPKYKEVTSQVDEFGQVFLDFEKLHKLGFVNPANANAKPVEVIETAQKTMEVGLKAMLALQNGLKREKVDKKN